MILGFIMVVLYYTQTYYLDAVIETIRSLKATDLQLHLVIEVAPESKSSNIIDIKCIDNADALSNFKSIVGIDKASAFEPYFKSVASIHFLVFKKSSFLNWNTFYVVKNFLKMFYNIKPKVIHFDTITLRTLLLIPFIIHCKKVITIHDPIAHIGESSWKKTCINYIYYHLADHFIFYSKYALNQFKMYYTKLNQPKHIIQFQPFTFNQQYIKSNIKPSCILFFGRISYYKGIDIFLEVIPEILKIYPDQIFVIAGKSDGYQLDYQFFKKYEHNILLLNRYINNNEVVQLIQKSKFLVCPYRDASQSGVLMTAKAIGKPVIATNVGAFSEYIQDGIDGLVVDFSKEIIKEKILYFLEHNRYKRFEKYVDKHYSNLVAEENCCTILSTYS